VIVASQSAPLLIAPMRQSAKSAEELRNARSASQAYSFPSMKLDRVENAFESVGDLVAPQPVEPGEDPGQLGEHNPVDVESFTLRTRIVDETLRDAP